MKPYRYKHIPTGLYYCLSRETVVRIPDPSFPDRTISSYVKTNLSKTGKVYFAKDPASKNQGPQASGGIYNHVEAKKVLQCKVDEGKAQRFYWKENSSEKYIPADWQVEYITK